MGYPRYVASPFTILQKSLEPKGISSVILFGGIGANLHGDRYRPVRPVYLAGLVGFRPAFADAARQQAFIYAAVQSSRALGVLFVRHTVRRRQQRKSQWRPQAILRIVRDHDAPPSRQPQSIFR